MSDEIISGLRNALERGESLDKAAQTFLNAGYNPSDVRESVNVISTGATNITPQVISHPSQLKIFPTASPQSTPTAPSASPQILKPKKKHLALIIILVLVLLLLVGGLIALMLFGESILNAMTGALK